MDQDDLFRRLALALAIGLLIGLERGWQLREEAEGERTAGLRTHALTGLLGGICAALSVASHPAVLVAGLVSFTAAFALFAWLEASSEHKFSVTGVVAAILTFVLGAYAVLGQPLVAVACSVATAVLLALKEPLHGWLRRLTWLELRAVLVLLAMSFLLLPVLPNRTIDPWDAINPAEIWLLAVLIAGVSFVGYVAVKCLGDQAGIAVAALAGGLTSSTATTLSFARLAREQPQASLVLAGGILLAGMVMIVRVVAIAVALAPTLSSELLVPAAAGALVLLAAGASLTLARRAGGGETASLELKNPFDLAAALKLAALIAIIMLLAKVLSSMSSTRGLYLLAAVSGIADLDPITLSMARVAGARMAPAEAAATAIIIAVGTNTATKAVMATAIAGRRVGIVVGACSAVAIIAIAAAHLLAPRLPFAESTAAGNALASFERCGNEPMRPFRCKVAAQRLSSLENMAPRRHVRA
jgi:uncharacterized membrane protein (DUF4010 family)